MQTIHHELRPTIIGEIKSRPTRIHEAMGSTGREHRRRLKVRDDLKAAGAKGAMDSVALAPIKLRGRDPVQVWDELLEQVSSVPRPAVPIHREGDLTEAVYFHEAWSSRASR